MVRRHHCVKFVVPLNLLNLRWEHRPCMSLCLFFSRFKISPSLEHSDMYGIKRLATGNGVSRTKDLLFLHGELYASGLPFIIKDCLTWPCLSLTLHESGCLFCISTLTWSEGSSSLALQLQTAMIHVSQCAGQSLRGREDGRRSWSIFHPRALLGSSGKRCASPESARCHGPHGLAVNSIVSTPPQLIWWLHMTIHHIFMQIMRATWSVTDEKNQDDTHQHRYADCKRRARQLKRGHGRLLAPVSCLASKHLY